ncbi:MAG TPA: ribonuclease P [Methanosarcinales archaeon]|nr:ribonuclease P [Methanosarcinales archaeon]
MVMRLLPSLRERRRYLAFEMLSENAITRRDFNRELERGALSLLGDSGASECRMSLLLFDGAQGKGRGWGIIRCVHTHTLETRAAIATICEVGGSRVAVRVIGTSGTVKGAKRFFD